MSKKPKMVICRNCNKPIAKKAKICPSCGVKNKKPFFKRWWFVLFVVMLVLGSIGSFNRNKKEEFDWNDVELCGRLPKPKSNKGTIISNYDDNLILDVFSTSRGDYNAYIEECQSMGYTIESEKVGDNYTAFNEDGYCLDLSYIEETMYIALYAPIEMGTLNWPKSEVAGLLPLPKSTVGEVSTDTENGCYIYVGETSLDDFNAYADECSDCGFSCDYERGDNFYNAKDENGNELSLSYQGNNVVVIQIRKPDEEAANASETEQESEISSATEQQAESAEKSRDSAEMIDGMRPEFKKAMDSYEEFMNEYCEFMEKYAESEGMDAGMLTDYASYLSKYIDMAEDFEAWADGEMNTAETAYYLDVQTRINKKILEVQ